MRILSGAKPSGEQLHIGNYLGALKRWVEEQNSDTSNEHFFFIPNLHAITSLKDGKLLKEYTLNIAAQYLAIGLDPKKSIIYVQSDVSYHTELTWILNCICPMGLLERAHSYKDAKAKNKDINVGVFDYPILMAADILLYQANKVPVGKDQKQHVEIARDIAAKFNHIYGETFVLPEAMISEETETIIGIDGQKMSKSYGNTIGLFEEEKSLKKKIMSIVTDSKGVEDVKDPSTCNVYKLLKHFASEEVLKEVSDKYKSGGIGYGDVKKLLLNSILEELKDIREKYAELKNNPEYLESILKKGAEKANSIALETMEKVKIKVGY
jgi:tryptophanyl-tRNA synthetase